MSQNNPTSGTSFLDALRIGLRGMRQHPKPAGAFLAATVAQGALQGGLVLAMQSMLLSFTNSEAVGTASLLLAGVLIAGLWSLRAGATFLGEVAAARLAHRVEINLMWDVLAKLLSLPVQFFDRSSQGDLVISSYFDLKGVRNVTQEIGRMVLHLTRLAGIAIAAWTISPTLTLVGMITVPLGALPAYWIGQRITRTSQGERDAIQTLYDSFLQINAGIRVIKVNLSENVLLERAGAIGRDLYHHLVSQAFQKGLARFLLEAVSGLGIVAVLVVGGRQVNEGALAWPGLLSLLIAMMGVYGPMVGLIQMYGTIRSVIPNLDRVETIMQTPAAVSDQANAVPMPEPPATIELRNVGFAYQDQTILEGISATFYQGETIGIVGPSGAGKSTLLSLLLRFYDPTQGAILLDGVDLRHLRRADLMRQSAIVLQEPFLFYDTVLNNIRVGRPDASMEQVVAAAKAANIHDEIMQMENGYDTLLGRGFQARGISGGQRQRLCIAAALLKNAPLLFLDEATSSLDSVSERQVQAAIERLMRGRTTLVIAHRLSTLRNADRIIVLEQGRVVGLGPHEELIHTCPTYQRLWGSQTLDEQVGANQLNLIPTGLLADINPEETRETDEHTTPELI